MNKGLKIWNIMILQVHGLILNVESTEYIIIDLFV